MHTCVFSICVCVCMFTPFNPFKSDSTATLVGYVNTLIIQMPQTEIESATIETPNTLPHCFLCPSTLSDSPCLPLLQGSLAIINSTPCRKLKATTSSCKKTPTVTKQEVKKKKMKPDRERGHNKISGNKGTTVNGGNPGTCDYLLGWRHDASHTICKYFCCVTHCSYANWLRVSPDEARSSCSTSSLLPYHPPHTAHSKSFCTFCGLTRLRLTTVIITFQLIELIKGNCANAEPNGATTKSRTICYPPSAC